MQPSRFALIICSPSEGDAYRLGTVLDTENLCNYLKTPRGGAWREEELLILTDPIGEDVFAILNDILVDYLLIYFSGHGGTSDGQRLLQFKDGLAIDWWFIAGASPRQLMIVDACRSELGAIGAIPSASEEWSSFTGESQARLLMDHYILQSPPGKLIIHSASNGQEAFETTRQGGVFTYSLLQNATYMRTAHDFIPVRIQQVLGEVKRELSGNSHQQRPVVAYAEGEMLVPFMISVPQLIEQQEPYPILNHRERMIAGIALVVGIYHLLKRAS